MPSFNEALASGDPLQLVLYWAVVIFAALIAWFILAIVFLPFYFGIKSAIDLAIRRAQTWAARVIQAAKSVFKGIVTSFAKLGASEEVKVFLQNDIRGLRYAVNTTGSSIASQLKALRKAADKAAATSGGVPGVMRRVTEEIDRLHTVPQLDAESIKQTKGRSVAWFRAILITIFWFGIVVLNTVMLHEFFKGLIPFRIPLFGFSFEVAWAISVFYTFVEFIFGFLLEKANEKREGLPGIGAMQLVLIPFILIAIFVEVALYTILSFTISWDWPEAIAASMPAWADGWLGALGLVIGGGVVFSGYFMGSQWAEVLRGNAVISMKVQARVLSHALDALPERLQRLKSAVDIVQGKPQRIEDAGLVQQQVQLTSDIEQRTNLLHDKLGQITAATRKLPPIEEASGHEVRRFRWKVVALGAGGIVAVIGNVLRMITSLNSTEIGGLGWFAPPTFAVVATILMLFAGRVAASALVVTHGRVASETARESHITSHGTGVTQWAGIALAALLLIFSGWAGTSGFRTVDAGGLSSSLAVNVATFMVGAFLEDIVRGVAFFAEAVARCVAGGLLALISLLSWVASMIVITFLFVIELVASPALWLWRTIRKDKTGNAPARGENKARQLTIVDEPSTTDTHLGLGEVRA